MQASPGLPATSAQPINYIILLIVLLVAGFQVTDRFLSATDTPVPRTATGSGTGAALKTLRTELNLGPIERHLNSFQSNSSAMDLSADGSLLVYSSFKDLKHRINVRNLQELDSRVLVEADMHIESPWISPGGEWVAYQGGPELYIVPISGGTPSIVARGLNVNSHRWLDNQSLIYGLTNGSWHRYSQLTGETTLLSDAAELVNFRDPHPLPDSEFVLFTTAQTSRYDNPSTVAFNFRTGEEKTLLNNAFGARYVESGHLLFMRDSTLWAVPFNLASLQIGGVERPVIRGIENRASAPAPQGFYAVSRQGLLIYISGVEVGGSGSTTLLTWINSTGAEIDLGLPPGNYLDPVLTADGQRLAVTVLEQDGTSNVWVHNLNQPGILNRVTTSGLADNAIWTPDGRDLIYTEADNNLLRINGSGAGTATSLMTSDTLIYARAFTPEGDLLIDYNFGGNTDIHLINLNNAEMLQQSLLASEMNEQFASVSPDGKLLVYASNETRRFEIYLRPYPNVNDNKWRISANGGTQPIWSSTGNVLHYLTMEDTLISVEVQAETQFQVGQQQALPLERIISRNAPAFAVAPEGDRFLFMKYLTDQATVDSLQRGGQQPVYAVVVENWFEELRELVPVN